MAVLPSLPDVPFEPEDELAERQGWASLTRTAMLALPKIQREMIELSYLAKLTQAEIAERLGVALSVVKSGLADALQRIAKSIEAAVLA